MDPHYTGIFQSGSKYRFRVYDKDAEPCGCHYRGPFSTVEEAVNARNEFIVAQKLQATHLLQDYATRRNYSYKVVLRSAPSGAFTPTNIKPHHVPCRFSRHTPLPLGRSVHPRKLAHLYHLRHYPNPARIDVSYKLLTRIVKCE